MKPRMQFKRVVPLAMAVSLISTTETLARPAFPNASFETKGLTGWEDPLKKPLASSAIQCGGSSTLASRLSFPGKPTLGGNYWDVPVNTRGGFQDGRCHLLLDNVTTPTTRVGVYSPVFAARGARYVSFLLDSQADRVGIAVVNTAGVTLQRIRVGSGPQHVVIDLHKNKGSAERVRLLISRGDGSARVDDFQLTTTPPAPVRPQPAQIDQLYGFADFHVHFFTQVGYGGRLFSGSIHSCLTNAGGLKSGCTTSSASDALPRDCGEAHGRAGDGVLTIAPEGGHHRSGYPDFVGWPSASSISHQQMYVDWLKRAYEGGLRLVHMDVSHNETMADVYAVNARVAGIPGIPAPNRLDDDWNIDAQINAATHFASRPDVSPWLEIAWTPAQARRIVSEGRLAVVLGAELDNFAGFSGRPGFWTLAEQAKTDPSAEKNLRDTLRSYLEGLYGKGIRHIFPIHLYDNPFGGSAVYDVRLDLGQYLFYHKHHGQGRFFETEDASARGIMSRYDRETEKIRGQVKDVLLGADVASIASNPAALAVALPIVMPLVHALPGLELLLPGMGVMVQTLAAVVRELDRTFRIQQAMAMWEKNVVKGGGVANSKGLTRAGEIFIEEAMRLGFVIDVSHMSDKSTNGTLDLAEGKSPDAGGADRGFRYPILAGHGGFRDTSFGTYLGTFNAHGFLSSRTKNTAPLRWENEQNDTSGIRRRIGTNNPEALANERALSAEQVERIRNLGGMLGVGVGPTTTPVKESGDVDPDCDGSSKAWVQHYMYAVAKMGRQGVALGTDANGLVPGVTPRFGPKACGASATDEIRQTYAIRQVTGQRNGVAYESTAAGGASPPYNSIRATHVERFNGPSALVALPASPDEPWNTLGTILGDKLWRELRPAREQALQSEWTAWAAIARFNAGRAPTTFDQAYGCSPGDRGMERDVTRTALGFWMAANGEAHPGTDFRCPGDTMADIKEAWNVYKKTGRSSQDPALYARYKAVWDRYHQMRGSNPPLQKSVTGTRDFDFNIDGQAHYGMLPDLLQDVRNVGLSAEDLAPLFRGANDFVVMWEEIERQKQVVKKVVH